MKKNTPNNTSTVLETEAVQLLHNVCKKNQGRRGRRTGGGRFGICLLLPNREVLSCYDAKRRKFLIGMVKNGSQNLHRRNGKLKILHRKKIVILGASKTSRFQKKYSKIRIRSETMQHCQFFLKCVEYIKSFFAIRN